MDEEDISLARGGPLYVPDMVGPLTSVSEFEASLKDLTSDPCSEFHHHEFSVNDLKLLSEDELFNTTYQAFKENNEEKEKRSYTIKQDQENFISAARLHSLSGDSGSAASVNLSEKKERLLSLDYTNLSTQVKSNPGEHKPLHDSETLLCVEVYSVSRQGTWVKSQEIMVLGRQTLTELRDKIKCSTDEIMNSAGKHDPSGYFLIEDIFYNDLREDNATDYSLPILTWLKEHEKDAIKKWNYITNRSQRKKKNKDFIGRGSGSKLPQLHARLMQTTRWCELRFRLGEVYLYCHQGDCKHVIVIRDYESNPSRGCTK